MVYKGTANLHIANAAFEAAIKLTSNNTNGILTPGFEVEEIEIDLPEDELSISVRGNLQAQFANFFKLLFTEKIRSTITDAIKNKLETELPPKLRSELIGIGHISKIFDGIGIDWQITEAPKITYDLIQVGSKAVFVLE